MTSPRTLPNALGRVLLGALAAVVAIAVLTAPAAQAAPPKRIVALTPFAANTLAGLGVRPVGIGQTLGGKERYASNLRGVKTLTLSHPNGPNMEELALLNPQLVLSSPTWAKGAKTMRDLDIKVVDADPANIAQTYSVTRAIGRLVGKREGAAALVKKMRARVKQARRGIRKRPRTLVVLGVGRTPFVMLGNSWGGSLVRAAGARLVTGGVSSKSGFARISDETILKANPDVIIAIPHANADDIPAVKRFLRNNPAWEDSKAVKDGRLYVSTDNSLLQAGTDTADVIRKVRRAYLKNR
jgi:iron complex transport system substrate-binding protein